MQQDRSAVARIGVRARTITRALKRNRFIGIPLDVQKRYAADRAGSLGATITYNAFLSLFPLLLLALSLVGFVLTDPADRQAWADRIARSIPGLGALNIQENLDALARHRAATGIVGLLSLAWTGTNVVRASGAALNTVHEVPEHSGLRSYVWALSTLASLGSLALLSVGASSVIGGLGRGNAVLLVPAAIVGVTLDFLLFLISYRLLTHRKGPRFGALWPGAAFAGIGWTILKATGVWYATKTVANASAVYGPFAVTVGLLVILSLASRVFLYGAELNAVLLERKHGSAMQKAINLSRHREMRRRA